MSMFAGLGIDLNNIDAEGVEKQAETGGLIPEGWHLAKLTGAKTTQSKTDNVGDELHFELVGGPFAERTIKDTLWRTEKNRSRILYFANRLGLLRKDGKVYKQVEGKEIFADCIDTVVAIEIHHEKYKSEQTGKEGVSAKLTMYGIAFPNEDKVKLYDGGSPATPAVGDKSPETTAPAAKTKVELGGL